MKTDTSLVTCDWCKKDFEPDADAFAEGGIDMFERSDDVEAWKGEPSERPIAGVPVEMLTEAERSAMKAEMEITDEQVDELLRTGSLKFFICICPQCRDDASSDDNPGNY